MRVVLDESVPRQLAPLLERHQVVTVPRAGWSGLRNGELLRRASGQFDVLVTGDQSLEYQQNLDSLQLAIVVVAAPSNRPHSPGRRPQGVGGCFVIVLDTATWIWRGSDRKGLTTRARRAIDEAERVLVSAISVWEVAMLVAKRRIQLDRPVEQWIGVALALTGLQLAPLEPAIAVRSSKLPGEFHPGPADCIIVATALENAVPIVTLDDRIRSYPHVQSTW